MKKLLTLIFVVPFGLLFGLIALALFIFINYSILSWGYHICFNLFHWLLFIFVLIPISIMVSLLISMIPGGFCASIFEWYDNMPWPEPPKAPVKYTDPSLDEIRFFNSLDK